MTGTTPATGARVSDPGLKWSDNWDTLRRLVCPANGAQVTLTRKWRLTVSGTPTVVSATAAAELVGSMAPTMTGRTRSEFVVEFLLADPLFYGTQSTTSGIAIGSPTTITNPGHEVAAHYGVEVDLIGPLTNPRLTNSTPNPDVWVQYTGTISSGVTVRLNVTDFSATRLSDSANVIAGISHSGARHWMGLLPGANSLTLTASAGSGTATVRYYPPYL